MDVTESHDGFRIGVDIGGTFTDVIGRRGDRVWAAKVPSSPENLVAGVLDGVEAVLALSGEATGAINRFVHGTTIATNAILEEKGARIGLLMTEGFEDVLEIGRQKRSRMYDLFMVPETPVFLAPGRRRAGISERIGPAAGALGGRSAGERSGRRELITLDIGGTSSDVALARGGASLISREGRIRGYPLRVPMVDVHTIGAGGGSIARLDDAGVLKVGPESAGADPGPARPATGAAGPSPP